MKEDRNIYLTNIPLEEARRSFIDKVWENRVAEDTEVIKVDEALDRVTVKPVFAKKSSPNYNAAAMDGVAVVASSTYGASESNPLRLKLGKDFMYINTGGFIQDPYDAVIMIEDVVEIDDEWVEIYQAAGVWQHIRPIGEDIIQGELILSAKHRIRPVDIGALLAGQIREIEVYKEPTVGIIPTGSEIINVNDDLAPGKIIESNSSMFAAMIKEYKGNPRRYPVVPDEYQLLKENILKAIDENDIVVINAGSSAGSKDFTANVLREIGHVVIHGVATKPGKPVILAIVNNKPVIGIPGYPVSAYFTLEFFLKPLISQYLSINPSKPPTIKATLSRRVVSSIKYEEYIRVKLGNVKDKLIATPLERGAGVTMSLVRADGVLIIPQRLEGYEAGTQVDIQLTKSIDEIKETIVSIGSHDLVMDLLSNHLHEMNSSMFLSSAHVGSLGGIMAMRKGECHIAPIHLMDIATGEYNTTYVKQYIKNEEMALIKFVRRSQGLMIKRGNPKGINGIYDLTRKDVVFANRQRGAGTRILLDYCLQKEGIKSGDIQGYDREMTTHMAVAAAIAGGAADCGMGVYSAAETMGLEFIPIAWEDYDLLVPQALLIDRKLEELIKAITDNRFINTIEALGGYNTENIGEVILL